jgi:purine-binding chemotaxis protein CheW
LDWDAIKARLRQTQELIERPETASGEHVRRVLLERAKTLSVPGAAETPEGHESILVFRSAGDRYGVLLSEIVEIAGYVRLTAVPGAPPHVAGLLQLRGEVRPVYRLERLIGTPGETSSGSEFVLLLRGRRRVFAILADEAEGVRDVRADSRRLAPRGATHVRWVTEDLVTVLDVQSLAEEER